MPLGDVGTRPGRSVSVWSYINKTETCWLWTGPTNRKGYGIFKGTLAHRYVYQLLKGLVPSGLVLDHIVCDNKKCVNPEHLKPVTNAENCFRNRKEFCKKGHPLSGSNLEIENGPYGKVRRCLTCHTHRRSQ